jgi:hypothetical protein
MSYKKDMELNRVDKDHFMRTSPHSPLSDKLKKEFISLSYFDVNEDYMFELELQKYEAPETIEMETSTGDIQYFNRLGYLEFSHPESKEQTKINIYQNVENPGHLFVPFRDKTSDEGITYGAGRYLELHQLDENKFLLDFNKAYSPFCAYSDNFTCPLPPFENWLEVPINAGEKAFTPDH